MACHYNSLHFLGQAPGSLSKMLVALAQGNHLAIFTRLRERTSAKNLLS